MALNATIGSDSANSYVTLSEATAYFEDRAHASDWESFEDQEKILITASRMLDWYTNWKGTKSSVSQSMDWPRSGAIRTDGTEVDDDIIPQEVKIATYELALSSLSGDRTVDNELTGIKKVQVSSLSIEANVDSTGKPAIPSKVRMILSDLISSGITVVRLMRA